MAGLVLFLVLLLSGRPCYHGFVVPHGLVVSRRAPRVDTSGPLQDIHKEPVSTTTTTTTTTSSSLGAVTDNDFFTTTNAVASTFLALGFVGAVVGTKTAADKEEEKRLDAEKAAEEADSRRVKQEEEDEEEERIAAEKGAAEAEARRLEEERVAAVKAAAEEKARRLLQEQRIAAEKAAAEAEAKRLEEEQRMAKEKAQARLLEQERIAREKVQAEARRLAEKQAAAKKTTEQVTSIAMTNDSSSSSSSSQSEKTLPDASSPSSLKKPLANAYNLASKLYMILAAGILFMPDARTAGTRLASKWGGACGYAAAAAA